MTPEEADLLAAEVYDGHPAAAVLILLAHHAPTEDERQRARLALSALDPMLPLPHGGRV